MKRFMLPLYLLSLLAFATPAKAAVIAVVTDKQGERVEFTDLGTLQSIKCHDQPVLCSEAFSICTSEGVVGAIVGLGVCIQPGKLEFVTIYTKTGATVLLKSTGTDGSTGAPLYDLDGQSFPIADGTSVFLVVNTPPKAGCCLGVHTFWEVVKGKGKVCTKRKLYNPCTRNVTVCSVKEFAKFCPSPGTFLVHNTSVGASYQNPASLLSLFLDTPGNTGATSVLAGSVGDELMAEEWNACAPTSAFLSGEEIGSRWEELYFSFRPGCFTLRPKQETFIPTCLSWSCGGIPPGTPCPCANE